MIGTGYLLNVSVLIVLIYLKIKSTHTSEGRNTLRWLDWTLNKQMSFLVHLPFIEIIF